MNLDMQKAINNNVPRITDFVMTFEDYNNLLHEVQKRESAIEPDPLTWAEVHCVSGEDVAVKAIELVMQGKRVAYVKNGDLYVHEPKLPSLFTL
jgi:hypothetical protein